MLDFRTKLRREIVEPEVNKKTAYTFSAIALPGRKTRGQYCDIRIRKNGKDKTVKGEISTIYGNDSTGGWYPKNNEMVLVEEQDGKYTILQPIIEDYDSYIANYTLKVDIFSTVTTGTAPSVLF